MMNLGKGQVDFMHLYLVCFQRKGSELHSWIPGYSLRMCSLSPDRELRANVFLVYH